MNKDINGYPLSVYQVVVDPSGQLLMVEEFLPNGQVKCRNGCMFIYWQSARLKRVNYKEDLL